MSAVVCLPETFNSRKAKYTLVKRGLHALIYSQQYKGVIVAYEVFQIKIRKPTIIKGVLVPAREKFPHDEAFGYWAKSVNTLEKAEEVFQEYEKRQA